MRVLFTTTAGAGHFHPLVPVARATAEAGHVVAFACPASFRPTVEALGFQSYAAGRDDASDPEVADLYSRVMRLPLDDPASMDVGNRLIIRMYAGPNVRLVLPDLRAVVRTFQPDLIVSEEAEFGGPMVAELHGLPYVTMGIGLQQLAGLWADSVAEVLDPIRVANGLPPDPDLAIHHRYLQLTYSPPSLEVLGVTRLPTVYAIRPEPFDDSAEPSPAWLDALPLPGSPMVYATLGTEMSRLPGIFPGLFRMIVDALAGEPVNLVMTVGRTLDPAELGELPSNARVERYVPQSRLLPRCAAMICHGGSNTVLGAVAAGVPLILTPIAADGPTNAERCAQLGVGLVVPVNERSPERIRSAVRAVLSSPEHRAAAEKVAAEIAGAPPLEHAVALLESIVGAHR